MRKQGSVLKVKNFAQLGEVQLDLGDLTIIVGPQATGKSLVLQWFKMAHDASEVVTALKQAGHDVKDRSSVIDLVFGEGMSSGWKSDSQVSLNGKDVNPKQWTKARNSTTQGKVFFIPAHRALLLAEGWPAPFLKLNADTPVVARLFSQNLYQRFSGRKASSLFPVERILKTQYRELINEAVFHGGRVELQHEGLRYRLGLKYSESSSLPFMTWTAGQREFTPLLLGLYHVLPSRKVKKNPAIDYVVIEEPEMGLHPQAISTIMVLVLDLLWRGYKVLLSTHSPLVLDCVWAMRALASNGAPEQLACNAFGLTNSPEIRKVMRHAMQADYKVHYMSFSDTGKVLSKDISELDPLSDDMAESNWGGLTEFSTRFGDAVRDAVNNKSMAE